MSNLIGRNFVIRFSDKEKSMMLTCGLREGFWGGPPSVRTFFVVQLDKPFSRFEHWSNGHEDKSGYIVYDNVPAGDVIQMKVGISFTSIDNARLNLTTECDHWDFDRVKKDSQNVWNDYFGRIDVKGGTKGQRTKFYTDLWHALMGRHKLNDVNGAIPDYTANDGKGNNSPKLKVRQLPVGCCRQTRIQLLQLGFVLAYELQPERALGDRMAACIRRFC